MMGHARWVQCLVAVRIVLSTLSGFHSLTDLMNVLLLFDVGWEGREYRLVDFFVVLKLLQRFFAFNFKFFYAFVLQSFQYTVSLSVSVVRLVEDDAFLVGSGIIIIISIRISTNLMMIRCIVILWFLTCIVSVLYTYLLTQGNYSTVERGTTSMKTRVYKLYFLRITWFEEIYFLQQLWFLRWCTAADCKLFRMHTISG